MRTPVSSWSRLLSSLGFKVCKRRACGSKNCCSRKSKFSGQPETLEDRRMMTLLYTLTAPGSILEGETAALTFTLNEPLALPSMIVYTTVGTTFSLDYQATPGNMAVYFAPGETTKTVYLDAFVDNVAEDTFFEFLVGAPGSNDRQFVDAAYKTVLGRHGDSEGTTWWTEQLAAGMTREQLTFELVSSTEHLTRQIRESYSKFLGRGIDEAGLQHWLNVTRQQDGFVQMLTAIAGSEEAKGRYANLNQFVQSLYSGVFGRIGSTTEVAYWVNQLAIQSPVAIAGQFVRSLENAPNLQAEKVETYLDRATTLFNETNNGGTTASTEASPGDTVQIDSHMEYLGIIQCQADYIGVFDNDKPEDPKLPCETCGCPGVSEGVDPNTGNVCVGPFPCPPGSPPGSPPGPGFPPPPMFPPRPPMPQNRSGTNPHPIVGADIWLPENDTSSPLILAADLTFGGLNSTTVYYEQPAFAEAGYAKFVLQIDATSLETGHYDWEITVTNNGNSEVLGSAVGTRDLINNINSEIGRRWQLDSVDKLFIEDDGVLLVKGDSSTHWFEELGGGDFARPRGDLQFSTLVQNLNDSFTLTDAMRNVYEFSDIGLLMSMTDRYGNTTTYAYMDADEDTVVDELEEIEDSAGRVTTFTYDEGLLATMVDFAGRTTTYVHDGTDLVEIIEPDPDGEGELDAPVSTYEYDPVTHLVTSFTTAIGRTKSFTYSPFLTVTSMTDENAETTKDYSVIATQGLVDLGSSGTLLNPAALFHREQILGSLVDENENESTYLVDRFGNKTYEEDAEGNRIYTIRDNEGRPAIVFGPVDDTFDLMDQADREAAPFTYNFYDALGNLATQQTRNGVETWEYDPDFNVLVAHQDVLGVRTTYTLDEVTGSVLEKYQVVGLVDDVENGEADDILTEYAYTPTPVSEGDPPAGLLASETDGLGHVTEYEYTERGLLERVTYAVGTADEAFVEYEYDSADNKTAFIDEIGRRTEYDYDDLNRLIKTTLADPDGEEVELESPELFYEYNALGRLTKETDALGRTTSYVYGAFGKLLSMTQSDPDGEEPFDNVVTKYGYNDAGHLISETDPMGRETTFTVDAIGRLVDRTDPDPDGPGGPLLSPVTHFEYDARSRVISTTDPNGNVTTTEYDDPGFKATTTYEDPDGVGPLASPVSVKHFDLKGRVVQDVDVRGGVTSYFYDALGRLIRRYDPDPDGVGGAPYPIAFFAYDKAHNLKFTADALGNTIEYVYDARNRLLTTQAAFTGLLWTSLNGHSSVEIQRVAYGASNLTGGTFTVSYGLETEILDWDATEGEMEAALEGMTAIDSVEVTRESFEVEIGGTPFDVFTWMIEFRGTQAGDDMDQLTMDTSNITADFVLDQVDTLLQGEGIEDEIQSFALSNYDSGTFTLSFKGETTDPLDFDATTGEIDAALEALTTIGTDGVTVSGGALPTGIINVEFHVDDPGTDQPIMILETSGYASPPRRSSLKEYDDVGQVISETDALDNVTEFEYDDLGRLIKMTTPDPDAEGLTYESSITTYGYDPVGNKISMIDPLLHEWTWDYDGLNRVILATDPLDGETAYTYDKVGNRLSLTDPVDNTTEWTYDRLNRVVEEANELGDSRFFDYDAAGNLVRRIDRNGRAIRFEYDGLNRMIEEHWLDANGTETGVATSTIATTVSGVAHINEVQDVGVSTTGILTGGTFTLTYNGQTTGALGPGSDVDAALEGLSNIGAGDVSVTKTVNTATEQRWQVTFTGALAGVNVNQITIDSSSVTYTGVLSEIETTGTQGVSGVNEVQTLALDEYADGGTFTVTYSGQTTSGIVVNASASTVEAALEALSNIDNVTVTGGTVNEVQNVGMYSNDEVTGGTFTLSFGGETTSALNLASDIDAALEGLTSIGSGNVSVTKTVDTAVEQRWQVTFVGALAGTNVEKIKIDASNVTFEGIMTETEATVVEGRTGGLWTIEFGGTLAATNVAQITTSLSGVKTGRRIVMEYDSADSVKEASDYQSTIAYDYDTLGRVIETSNAGSPGFPTVVLTHEYDSASRRTGLSATISSTADFDNSYSYDRFNRLTRIDQVGQGGGNGVSKKRVDFAYNDLDQYTGVTRYKDVASVWTAVVATTYDYDLMNRLTDMTHTRSSNSNMLADYDWDFDEDSRLTDFTTSVDSDENAVYDYDATNQLIDVDRTSFDESFDWDANGNREDGSYDSAANNRMTTDGTYTYEYDAEGNRTAKESISTGERVEYVWDFRNRLERVIFKDDMGATVASVRYIYDAQNHRIAKLFDTDGNGDLERTEGYIHDGDDLILAFTDADGDGVGSGALTERFLYGAAVDEILAEEQIDTPGSAGDTLWQLADHLGTIRDIADDSGAVVNHIVYDAFGNIIDETAPTVLHRFGFTGREHDIETGMRYHRARYFDGHLWINEDPIGLQGNDTNLSRYVGNAPHLTVDPSGLMTLGAYGFPSAPPGSAVWRCTRPAFPDTLVGQIADVCGLPHHFGIVSNECGQVTTGGGGPGTPLIPNCPCKGMIVNNHGPIDPKNPGKGAKCDKVLGVDLPCVEAWLSSQDKKMGPWMLGVNDCKTLMDDILENCKPGCHTVMWAGQQRGVCDIVKFPDGSGRSPEGVTE